MRSEGDCVWQIPFEPATLRDRCFIGSEAVPRVMLIFQALGVSTQSARIRTGVNEMMTRFVPFPFLTRLSSAPPLGRFVPQYWLLFLYDFVVSLKGVST